MVDDEPGLRLLLTQALRRDNYTVIEANNGAEALALFTQQPIHLVILDLMMPLLDGFTTCITLRQHSSVSILVLSAHAEPRVQQQARQCGANHCLKKPVRLAELQSAVQTLLEPSA